MTVSLCAALALGPQLTLEDSDAVMFDAVDAARRTVEEAAAAAAAGGESEGIIFTDADAFDDTLFEQ